MGRSLRVRDGLIVRVAVLGARKQRIAKHASHDPNPNKLVVSKPQWDGTLFPPPEAATSPAMKELDIRRKKILDEAVRLNILAELSPGYQKQLQTRFTGSPQPLEEAAMSEGLDTIEFIMQRLQARANCELLRLKLQQAVISGGPIARFIQPNVRYDLNDETPRTLRPITCDERSAHYREAIAKYLAPGS